MSAVGGPVRASAGLVLEWRAEVRRGVPLAALALAVLWSAVLAAVPAPAAPTAALYVLIVDTAGFGALFAVVLVLFERAEGAHAALAVTPLRTAEYVGAKLAVLTALATALAVPLTLAAARERSAVGAPALPPVLLGVALLSLLLVGLVLAVCGGAGGLGALFTRLAPVVAPLVLAPVLHVSGALDHPLLYAVPTTGAAELIRAGLLPQAAAGAGILVGAVLYQLAWIAAAVAFACRAVGPETARRGRGEARAPTGDAGAEPTAGPGGAAGEVGQRAAGVSGAERPVRGGDSYGTGSAVRGRGGGHAVARRRAAPWFGLAHIDLRGTWRDPMLTVMLLGPVVLASALRWGYPPVRGFLAARYGLELDPVGPVLLAALVVLHVPLMIGSIGALRTLADADEGTLALLRVSPLGLNRYLAYRLAATATVSAAGLAAAVPLSGLAAEVPEADLPALAAALVLAALQSTLLVPAAAAFAPSKVEALVVIKTAGAVFTLLPAALWWLPLWAQWFFAPIPLFWPVAVLPGYGAAPWPAGLAAGAAVTALAGTWLLRRTRRRLEGGG